MQGGLGTPTYMAPEQVEAAHLVGPESDIYAIGKTLYFLAVGELPTTIFPEKIPSPLRAVALKCMSTDPSDRFRTVEELLAALSPKPHGTSEHPPGQHEKVQPGPDRGKPKRSAKARPSEAIAHKDAMVRARRTSELPDVREQVGRLRVGKAWPFSVAEAQKRQRETAEALGLPVEYEVTLGAGAAMDFVLIPPGEFLMGSENREKGRTWAEGPVHRVRIEAPFYIGKFPVTQRQWQALMRGNPGKAMADRVPVSGVLWRYCQDFVASLVKSVKLPNGFRWVLPSEAQWEYACRAGASTRYCFGDDPHLQTLGLYAWYEGDSGGGIHAVGEKRPNAWGLHDMHGNVLEWCADVWHRNYRGAPEDGSAWDGAPDRGVRVLRGGSWFFGPNYCRSAFRYCPRRTMVWSDVGLRVSLQIR